MAKNTQKTVEIDVFEPEIVEKTEKPAVKVEKTEKTAEKVVEKTEKPAEKPEKVSIRGNPYLSDAQKDVLIDWELRRFFNVSRANPRETVLMTYTNASGEELTALATCYPQDLEAAWHFYRDNVPEANGQAFLARMSNLATINQWVARDIRRLTLD